MKEAIVAMLNGLGEIAGAVLSWGTFGCFGAGVVLGCISALVLERDLK